MGIASATHEVGSPELERLANATRDGVRYIKLGAGGAWEIASLKQGRILWGNSLDPHDLALAGDWDAARQHYLSNGIRPDTATGYVRELKDLYTSGSDTLWITFAGGFLWWAFAESDVMMMNGADEQGSGLRYRRTIGPWRNTDVNGLPLAMADLSSSLTKVAAYRRTICSVEAVDYLLRRLKAQPDPAVAKASAARAALADAMLPLIQQLHQSDFELFTDLLFSAIGWRRVSALGGTMKDIDLLIELSATGERACVQVKSAADQRVLDACTAAFNQSMLGDRFIFVCHTAKGPLLPLKRSERPVEVFAGMSLAEAAVAHGMTDWLLARCA